MTDWTDTIISKEEIKNNHITDDDRNDDWYGSMTSNNDDVYSGLGMKAQQPSEII